MDTMGVVFRIKMAWKALTGNALTVAGTSSGKVHIAMVYNDQLRNLPGVQELQDKFLNDLLDIHDTARSATQRSS
jgi:hypothetical protein